jgi:hypothetical protein
MMKAVSTALGVILCIIGVVGFFSHDFLDMDLNPLHDVILLAFGVVSLYVGINGSRTAARNMCRVLGVVFAILGIMTLFADAGTATAGNVSIDAPNVLKLIPGHLEYTTADGVRDIIVGLVGLVAGFMPRDKEREIDRKAERAKEKAQERMAPG